MAAITLHALRKSYGSTAVIHELSASIEDGEFVVIVGPSGCGKSTLLRMIAGLETVTAGTIRIGDRIVNDLEPKDRDIAMVFQSYALYPHMSVFDNIAYGLRMRGESAAEIRRKVDETARLLELTDLLQRRPRELSGGQRQRVAMGRAIVRQPAVFLFDEPLSNLDARLRAQMRLEIQRLHRTFHRTSILVTHDQVEAMTLGQRLLVMNAGRVEQFATPAKVYNDPATTFVATFVGAPPMNLLPRRVLRDTGLPTGWVQVGIRPESLALKPLEGDAVAMPLTVESIESLGADTLLHGRIDGEALVVRLPGFFTAGLGSALTVFAPRHRLYGFDGAGCRMEADVIV